MSHVDWANSKTALYYLKLAGLEAPFDLLTSDSSLPQSQEESRVYNDFYREF